MRKNVNAVAVVNEVQVNREGTATFVSIILLEAVMTIAALCFTHLIGECAGLWHHSAGLHRDLLWYYGAVDYASRAAKWFGFRKTCWNFILAVGFEIAMLNFISKRLNIDLHSKGSTVTTGESILALGAAAHICVYLAVAVFSRSSSMYGPLQNAWGFSDTYARVATHDRTWILFWVLTSIVLTLVIQALQKNRAIALCVLSVVGLVAVWAFANKYGLSTWGAASDFLWDAAILIEKIGDKIFFF